MVAVGRPSSITTRKIGDHLPQGFGQWASRKVEPLRREDDDEDDPDARVERGVERPLRRQARERDDDEVEMMRTVP